MKKIGLLLLAISLVATFALASCQTSNDGMMKDDSMMEDDGMMDDDSMKEDDGMMDEEGTDKG